jgi:hypothetical protein
LQKSAEAIVLCLKKNKGRAEHEVKGLKECNFDEEKDADNEGTKTIGLGKR